MLNRIAAAKIRRQRDKRQQRLAAHKHPAANRRLRMEALEDRRMLAVVISEIMWNPDSNQPEWEWIEVLNNDPVNSQDLTGYVLDTNAGPAGSLGTVGAGSIAPGNAAVLFNDATQSVSDMQAVWGASVNFIPVSNWQTLFNASGGTRLGLWDSVGSYGSRDYGAAVDDVDYLGAGFPSSVAASSVYVTDLSLDNSVGANWAVSTIGVDGAFKSNPGGSFPTNQGFDIGSPGEVPRSVSITANDATKPEGSAGGTTTFTFDITLSAALAANPSRTITVDWATVADTATAGDDYVSGSGTIIWQNVSGPFPPLVQTVSVTVNHDVTVELDETFDVVLSNLTDSTSIGVSLGSSTATGTIVNDDAATLTIADNSGNEDGGDITFTATLSNPVDVAVSAVIDANDGTATIADSDYTDIVGQALNFTAGVTSQTFVLTPTTDAKVELDETVEIQLSALGAAGRDVTLGTSAVTPAIATIINDDAATIAIGDASVLEGTGGSQDLVFDVDLNAAVDVPVTVDFATSDGSALDGSDYTGQTGSVTFPAGAAGTQQITIALGTDAVVEADENFTVTLGNIQASGRDATFADDTASGTILNDDAAQLSIADVTMAEGTGGTTTYTFTATLSHAVDVPVSVAYGTTDGTAKVADGDYTAASGTLNFAGNAGETQTLDVTVNADSVVELDEDFTVTLSNILPTNRDVSFLDSTATGTITNDDATDFAINDVSQVEGSGGGTTNFIFTVSLTNEVDVPVQFDVDTSDGAAVAPGDYTSLNTSGSIPAGSLSTTITVAVGADDTVELSENFFVDLSAILADGRPINVVDDRGEGTIGNDDTAVLNIGDVTLAEGSGGGATAFNFEVTLSNPVDTTISVDYTSADDTANLMEPDYTPISGTLNIGSGSTSETLTVNVNADDVVELDETFQVVLSNLVNSGRSVTLVDALGLGTIENDDAASITIDNPTVLEGDAGTASLIYTVTLDTAVDAPVTVDFTSADGTAMQPGDYAANSGMLNFLGNAGETITVTIDVNGDELVELDETVLVNLSNLMATGRDVTFGDDQGVGTIINDDSATISIDDVTLNEGNGGTTAFTFTVTLDSDVDTGVDVTYSTADDSATTGDSDYTAASGTLNFTGNMGETQQFTVNANGDNKVELTEQFFADLTGISAGGRDVTFADDEGIGTITNDDAAVLNLDSVSGAENGGALVFTATLSNPVDVPVSALVNSADDTATLADNDYTQLINQSLAFATEATSVSFLFAPTGDNKVELDETVDLLLSALSANGRDVSLGIDGEATILNDDSATLDINDVSIAEGTGGTTDLSFTVTLSAEVDNAVAVDFATADNSATTGDNDYTGDSGTLSFAGSAGETQTVTIAIGPDAVVELDETFFVNLSNVVAGGRDVTIGDGQGVGTILNDDNAAITIDDPSVVEGDSGTANLIFTVTLDTAVDTGVTVDFASADGTATQPSDYASNSGTLSFAGNAGETQTVTIAVSGDTLVELDETVLVNLSNVGASGRDVTIGDSQGSGTITNDDSATLSIDDVSLNEGDGGSIAFNFTVTLDADVDTGVDVGYQTANGSATTGDSDYTAASGTLNFAGNSGETQAFTVNVTGDEKVELDETFFADLVSIAAGGRDVTFADDEGLGTILNDDSATLAINDVTLNEGDAGSTAFTFSVTLDADVDVGLSTTWATADGTATTGDSDYTAGAGTLNFAGNSGEVQTVTVNVTGDEKVELNESFFVNLLSIADAGRDVTFADDQGLGTITNDDTATLSINDVTLAEGNSGPTAFTFTVTLDADVDVGVNVDYASADGSATTGDSDYTAGGGTLSFAGNAGETQTLTINATGDNKVELDETFFVDLSNIVASGRDISFADDQGLGTILNDDSAALSINDVTLNEGDAGTTTFTFTVTLDAEVDTAVSVPVATADDSATTGDNDYLANSDTLNFTGAAGETVTFDVSVNGDNTVELNERFFVNLGPVSAGGRNVTVSDGQGDGNVSNDDSAILKVDSVAGPEDGPPLGFTVSLTNPVDVAILAQVNTADSTATLADNDYVGATVNVNIAAGDLTQTFTVGLVADNKVELDETFDLLLSALNNSGRDVTLGAVGVGTITNDDSATLDLSSESGPEDGGLLIFTATLSNPVDVAVTAQVDSADDTATLADNDYAQISALGLSIPAGATSDSFTFSPTADGTVELDETVDLLLSALSAVGRDVSLGTDGVATIENDDSATISIDDVSMLEGTPSGITPFIFTVTLDIDVDTSFDVTYATADGTVGGGQDAVAPSDYAADAGAITFAGNAGETQTITVNVNKDEAYELLEFFNVKLTGIIAGGRDITFADDQGEGAIQNDDTDLIIDGTPGDDLLIVTATGIDDGSYQIITDGVPGPVIPFVDVTSLTFNGDDGDDILRLDSTGVAGDVFRPTGGVVFNGQGEANDAPHNPPGDALEIFGVIGAVVSDHTGADSGQVTDSAGTDVTYTGLEPMIIGGPITTFTANLNGLDNDAILETNGPDLRVRSLNASFENVTFSVPSVSVTVNGLSGDDEIQLDDLSANYAGPVTLNGDADTDVVNVLTNGNLNTPGGVNVPAGDTLTGDGTVSVPVSGAAGSTISSSGTFDVGDGSSSGYSTSGTTRVDATTLTILDNNVAVMGSLTELLNGGVINAANGISQSSGELLRGTGTINGSVSVNSATVEPGVLATGAISFGSSGTLQANIDGNTPGAYGQLVVTGNVSLNSSALDVSGSVGYAALGGEKLTIIDNDGVDPISGTFNGIANGDIVNVPGAGDFVLFYNGGDGNDVVLIKTFVPLPIVYVDDGFAGTIPGEDPDGAGPAQAYLIDSFPTIQQGVDAVDPLGTVSIYAGTYSENVSTIKDVALDGASGIPSDVEIGTAVPGAAGIEFNGADGAVSNVTVSTNGPAIYSSSATSLTVENTRLIGNTQAGISTDGTNDITLIDVTASGNDRALDINGADTVDITTTTMQNTFGSTVDTSDFLLATGGGDDTIEIGTPGIGGDNNIRYSLGATVMDVINLNGAAISTIDVSTDAGIDDVLVAPHPTAVMTLDGGDPTVSPGDTLLYLSDGVNIPTVGADLIETPSHGDINFFDFELVNIAGTIIVQGTGDDDVLEVTATSNDDGFYQLTTTPPGIPGPIVNFTDLTSLIFNALGGDDTLIVHNPAGGVFLPLGSVVFNAGADDDDLFIDNGDVAIVEHQLLDDNNGNVFFNGTLVVDYNDVEGPLTDEVPAGQRILTTSFGNEALVVSDDPAPNLSLFESTPGGVDVLFSSPANILSINLLNGNDTLDIQGFDPTMAADLTVASDGGGADAVQVSGPISIGGIDIQADRIDVLAGVSSNNNDIDLDAPLIVVADDVDAGTGQLTIEGGPGGVSQTGGLITAAELLLQGNVLPASFQLTNTELGTVAADVTGFVNIGEQTDITVGTVDGVAGIDTNGFGVLINAGGAIALDNSITAIGNTVELNAGGPITGDGTGANDVTTGNLISTADGGIGVLDVVVANLAFANTTSGDVTINEAGSLNIANLGAVPTSSNSGGAVTINAGGTINVNTNLSATGLVTLNGMGGNVEGGTVQSDTGLIANAFGSVDLTTQVPALESRAVTGLIAIDNTGDLVIGGLSAQNGLAAASSIDVQTIGNLTINELIDSDADGVSLDATGTINQNADIDSEGGGVLVEGDGEVTINAGIHSGGDAVSVESTGSNVVFTALGFITTETGGTGNVDVDANGAINMADGSFVNAFAGNINFNAFGGDVLLGRLVSQNIVDVRAVGSILDNGDTGGKDVEANSAVLLSLGGSVGQGINFLDTMVSTLEAEGPNGIWIENMADLVIGLNDPLVNGLLSTGGPIILLNHGSLDISEDVIADGVVNLTTVDTVADESLSLRTTITVRSDTSDVTLGSADNMTLEDSSTVSAANGTAFLFGDVGNADPGQGSVMLLYGTIESGSQAMVLGGPDGDLIDLNPGVTHFADSIELDGQGGNDQYIVQFGRLTGAAMAVDINDTGVGVGVDTAIVNGTSADEMINVHNNQPNGINPQTGGIVGNTTEGETVNYTETLEDLTVHGQDGEDMFFVQPSQTAVITINGGSPNFGDPLPNGGDKLDFDPFGEFFNIDGKTIFTEGGDPDPFLGVNFRNIEQLPLTPIGGTTLLFDMDHYVNGVLQSVTETGYTSVPPLAHYGVTGDFGWDVPLAPSGVFIQGSGDTGAGSTATQDDLLRDQHLGAYPRIFSADVPDGWYLVGIKLGSDNHQRDNVRVTDADSGREIVSGLTTVAGQFADITGVVRVKDGSLNLQFETTGGSPYWAVASIEIRPGEILTFGSPDPGVLTADGITIDNFTGYEATPDTLITIATTLGTIVTPDASPDYAGIQVLSNAAGEFSYAIQRPTARGTALVSMQEVTAAQTGCLAIDYIGPLQRLLDFNRNGSPTQSPGTYLGVDQDLVYQPGVSGIGWDTFVGPRIDGGFDRGFAPGPEQADLRRDSHFGTNTTRMFIAEVAPNADYWVNVTTGDSTHVHNQLTVNANGTPVFSNLTTGGGTFAHNMVLVNSGSAGLISVDYTNGGGAPYWVANGLEIREAGLVNTVTFGSLAGPDLTADGGPRTLSGTAAGVADGTLLTISTTDGSIIGPDVSATYQGVQVMVTGGAFSVDILAPIGDSTPLYTAEAIDGSAQGEDSVGDFDGPAFQRFDFNGSLNDTAVGFTGVRRTDVFSGSYGWSPSNPSQPYERQTSTASPATVALYRDSVYFNRARTFQVAVPAGGTFDVEVYVGDQNGYRRTSVAFEGGPVAGSAITTPGVFDSIIVMGVADDGDGILNITFNDLGGIWAVNGFDVAEPGMLPGTAPLAVAELGAADAAPITEAQLEGVRRTAIDIWAAQGLNDRQLAAIESIPVEIRDLDRDAYLGLSYFGGVLIDDNGAGYGWNLNVGRSPVGGQVDLLTTVMHEFGHQLGLPDLPGLTGDLMSGVLHAGQRRLTGAGAVDEMFSLHGRPFPTGLSQQAAGDEASANIRGPLRSLRLADRNESGEQSDSLLPVDSLFEDLGAANPPSDELTWLASERRREGEFAVARAFAQLEEESDEELQ